MLVAVLAEDDSFARSVAHRIRLSGNTAVRYRDPVKLLDNIPELGCDAVVVRQADFPMQWQTLAAALPRLVPGARTRFILGSTEAQTESRSIAEIASILGASIVADAFSAGAGPSEREASATALARLLGRANAHPSIHAK